MAMATVIAIGTVVTIIPIGAAATADAAVRMRHRCPRVVAPTGGIVVNDSSGGTAPPAVGRDEPDSCGDNEDL
jgi:hypothetical protein